MAHKIPKNLPPNGPPKTPKAEPPPKQKETNAPASQPASQPVKPAQPQPEKLSQAEAVQRLLVLYGLKGASIADREKVIIVVNGKRYDLKEISEEEMKELQEAGLKLSAELLDLIDKGSDVDQEGNKVWTLTEVNKFMDVLAWYSKTHHVSQQAAADIYRRAKGYNMADKAEYEKTVRSLKEGPFKDFLAKKPEEQNVETLLASIKGASQKQAIKDYIAFKFGIKEKQTLNKDQSSQLIDICACLPDIASLSSDVRKQYFGIGAPIEAHKAAQTAENTTKWLKGDKVIEKEETRKTAAKGRKLSSSELRELSLMRADVFSGSDAKAIEKLKKWKEKNPDNIPVRQELARRLNRSGKYMKALDEAAFVYAMNPNDQSRGMFIRNALIYEKKKSGTALSAEERRIAGKVYRMLRALKDSDIDEKIKNVIDKLAVTFHKLRSEPLEGEMDYEKVLREDDSKLAEVRVAYDKMADQLAKSFNNTALSSNVRIRTLLKLAEIEGQRRNYKKIGEYFKQALEIYKKGSIEKDLKEIVQKQIETVIATLCRSRHVERVKIAQGIVKAAGDLNILDDFDIKIKTLKKEKGTNEVKAEEKTIKNPKDLDELIKEAYYPTAGDEASQLIQFFGSEGFALDKVSSYNRKRIMLPLVYMFMQKGCLREVGRWAVGFARAKGFKRGHPMNPIGKFRNVKSATSYLQKWVEL